MRRFICSVVLLAGLPSVFAQVPAAAIQRLGPLPRNRRPHSHPVNYFVYERARMAAWQWFAAPPYENSYRFGESLLRFGVSQDLPRWDWKIEATQASVLSRPTMPSAQSPRKASSASAAPTMRPTANNDFPAALFLKQGYARYHFNQQDKNARIGRFEFFDGLETKPKNATIAYLQPNRVAQRLLGNFSFTVAQRSFDGVDGHYGQGSWDITAMAGRADQGVFNMNGNPELNVDVQYLAYTKSDWQDKFLWRVFAIGYHDGRTFITKTDNRPLAIRQHGPPEHPHRHLWR